MTCDSDRTSASANEIVRVERAAACLSPIEREILILSAAHKLDCLEIARWLGLSRIRAERILARALRKFDHALARGRRR
jgi:DNA-directed RNA polymerase specialized sigma24 family protein